MKEFHNNRVWDYSNSSHKENFVPKGVWQLNSFKDHLSLRCNKELLNELIQAFPEVTNVMAKNHDTIPKNNNLYEVLCFVADVRSIIVEEISHDDSLLYFSNEVGEVYHLGKFNKAFYAFFSFDFMKQLFYALNNSKHISSSLLRLKQRFENYIYNPNSIREV